jgi:cobalt-zinc-cadmium efflux system outer membrane protein
MKLIFVFFIGLGFLNSVFAESDPTINIDGFKYKAISFSDYLKEVHQNSASINSKQLGVQSSKAMVAPMSASNFSPSFNYSKGAYYNLVPFTPYVSPSSNTYSLSGTLEGWGKRQAREEFANSEVVRNESELISLKKTVESDAIFAYLDTLRVKLNWFIYRNAIDNLIALKEKEAKDSIDDLSVTLDNISNDLKFFGYGLITFVGKSSEEGFIPEGNSINTYPRNLKLNELINEALSKRVDLIALSDNVKSADASANLVSKNRNIDFSPSVWYSTTPPYVSSGTQYGTTHSYGFSVSIPIPIQLRFDGDLVSAANNKAQAEYAFIDAKNRVVVEVKQAFLQYNVAKEKLKNTEQNLKTALKKAKPATIQSIKQIREKSTELIDAKVNHAKALIFLLRVSGDYEIPQFN